MTDPTHKQEDAPALPAGWRIERLNDGGIGVTGPDGSCAAVWETEEQPRIIPCIVLYSLADAILRAAPAPTAGQQGEARPAPVEVERLAESLFAHIKHGDGEHQAWLHRESHTWVASQFAALATQAAPEDLLGLVTAALNESYQAGKAADPPGTLSDWDEPKTPAQDALFAAIGRHPAAASGERDTLRALLREVFDAMDEGDGQAPGHGHSVRGQWDDTGAPCTWCATWIKVRAALADGGAK